MRTIAGFLVAPIVPVIVVGVFDRPAARVIALFAYLTVLVLGVPAHLILHKFMWLRWSIYTLAGFLIGAVGGVIVGIILVTTDYKPPGGSLIAHVLAATIASFKEPLPFLFFGFLGAVGGLAFWLIARPDSHHAVPPGT
jgi:hypothetical protein